VAIARELPDLGREEVQHAVNKPRTVSVVLGIVGIAMVLCGVALIVRFGYVSRQMADYLEAGGDGAGSTFDQVSIVMAPVLIVVGIGMIVVSTVQVVRARAVNGRSERSDALSSRG